jgi:hypothetical protein
VAALTDRLKRAGTELNSVFGAKRLPNKEKKNY